MIKTIIFDFDGVIVESMDIKTAAFIELFKNEAKPIVEKIVNYHITNMGVSRYDKFRYIYKNIIEHPLYKNEFNKLCGKFSELVKERVINAPFVKGAEEFLEQNAKNYRYFLVSATPEDELKKIVRKKRLNHFFKKIYGAPFKKRDAVKDVLKKEKISPPDVLYVGDAKSDYLAARANSVKFIARIKENRFIFRSISCRKIKDLSVLNKTIKLL